MKLNEKYESLLTKSGLDTPLRVAHFMAQLEHESGLKPIQENLNYSAQGLLTTFPKYFTSENVTKYARDQVAIANKVYSKRMGNGVEISGDGYKYRGRGFIQLTGKENYINFSNDSGIDVLNKPNLLLEEANAMICAIWFWNKKGLNDLSDNDDIVGITKRINGGTNGLEHRKECLIKWKLILG